MVLKERFHFAAQAGLPGALLRHELVARGAGGHFRGLGKYGFNTGGSWIHRAENLP